MFPQFFAVVRNFATFFAKAIDVCRISYKCVSTFNFSSTKFTWYTQNKMLCFNIMPKHCYADDFFILYSISYAKILKYVFFVNCYNIRAVFTHILRILSQFLAQNCRTFHFLPYFLQRLFNRNVVVKWTDYTPCPEKGATTFLPITLPNAYRFSKFFH